MMPWLSRLLPTCRDMSRLLSDAMDRDLPFHMRARMRLHLLTCVLCERYKDQLHLIREALRKDDAGMEDKGSAKKPCLSAEAKERIQRALDSHRR